MYASEAKEDVSLSGRALRRQLPGALSLAVTASASAPYVAPLGAGRAHHLLVHLVLTLPAEMIVASATTTAVIETASGTVAVAQMTDSAIAT